MGRHWTVYHSVSGDRFVTLTVFVGDIQSDDLDMCFNLLALVGQTTENYIDISRNSPFV